MAKIFKNYEEESEKSKENEEEKMERLSIEGYEKSITLISSTIITTLDYQLISANNQWLHGVIRYQIRILTKNILYRVIVDF